MIQPPVHERQSHLLPQTASTASSSIPDVQRPLAAYLPQLGLILPLISLFIIPLRGILWWSSWDCQCQVQAFLILNLNPLKSLGPVLQYEELMLLSNEIIGSGSLRTKLSAITNLNYASLQNLYSQVPSGDGAGSRC